MNKKLLLSLVPLLLIGVFLGIPSVVPPVHAAGTVCFNDPASFTTTAPCAPAGFNLNGPAPNIAASNPIPAGNRVGTNQTRVGIYLSGPDLINGFDITVLTNRAVLRPAAVDFSNTILAAPTSIVVECLDGALVTGPTCLSTDVPGTIHLSLSGAAGVLSTASTGLLFAVVYNITGRTPSTGQIIQFQTGCGSPTSPTSNPPNCVTITNGGSGPVSESLGTIRFNNSANPNYVAISTPSTSTYTFLNGNPSPLVKINATAENNFPDALGIGSPTISFTSVQSAALTVSFTGAVTSCSAASPTSGTTGLPVSCGISASFSATSPGTYSVTFYGNYVYSNDTDFVSHGTLAGAVSLVINIQDVSWTVNGLVEPAPAQNYYMAKNAAPIQFFVTVTSVGTYSGTITISSAAVAGTTGLVITNPPAFALASGQTLSKTVNGTATGYGSATYITRLTVSGFALIRSSGTNHILVSGFTLTSNSTSVTFAPSGSGHVQLSSTSLGVSPNQFAGSVALTAPFTGPAGGVLTFTYTPGSSITLTAGGTGSVVVAISGTTPGTYTVTFTGTGGTNNDMTNSTAVSVIISGGKNSPTIATTLSASTIVVGQTVTDSSTLTGATATAGGTVSYLLFLNGACTAPSSTVSIVTVTNAVVPNSRAVLFNATGPYSFQAVYSGDTGNNGAPSPCEPLTVNKTSPTLATTLSTTTPVVGTTVIDSATLSSFFQAGGTVQYNVYPNGACTAPFSIASVVTVLNGAVPNSRAVLFNSTGAFAFQAVYSGDANNNGATSLCEPLTVQKASPTIATTLSSTSIIVGTTATDSSTLTGGFQASGTVTYRVFTNGLCTAPGTVASTVTVTGGVVPNSRAVTFNATGSYSFQAAYSGDTNNNAATSPCEPLTVNKASPTIATTLSSTSIIVGTSVTDSSSLTGSFQAGGTVTYSIFTNGLCTAPGSAVSTVTVTGGVVPNSRAVTFNSTGSFSFQAVYGGDTNNNGATSLCEPLTVNKTSPTIATTLSSTSVVVGNTVTDSSALTGSFQAGGTATYSLFTNGLCTAPGTVVSTVTVAGGVVPNSRAVRFNSTGSFSFNAVYSGDANNNGATSLCEPLTVIKASPTIATTLSATTINVGTTATDSATLTNSFSAGGTVSYSVFANGLCTAPGNVVSIVSVTASVVPNSRAVLFNSTGSFSFQAVYSGDANNNGATSLCEPLTVQKVSPTIATTLSSTTPVVGTTVTDSSTITGGFNAGGTVTYSVFANGVCTAPGTAVSTVTVTAGVVPNSRAVLFNSTGAFAFRAVYSGDANNNGATSACEPLNVQKASPTIATTLSSTSIVVGNTVTDSSALTGAFQAGGTVTYNVFTNGLCTAPGSAVSIVTVTGGVVPNSRAVRFNNTGSFSFNAVYSGDANNNGATSACEPLTVTKITPTIATTLSATTINVGTTATDSAALTNSFSAGGTVAYSVFTNGLCTAPGTVVSTVIVTGGVVPNSRAVLFNATGSYSFQAVYSGDANNNGATSPCEPLTVQKASPTIATTLSSTTPVVGTTVTDSSTLTGGFSATGTVTYSVFANGLCTAPGTAVSTVTVTGGVVPNSRAVLFNSTGSFSFQAVYSGDANNNGATSACEPLTVQKASPTIATTLSSTSIIVGNTVTDSSTLTGGFQAGGTATYNVFTNGLCTAPGTAVSTVTVTGGVVPNSRAVRFNSTGSFSFNAVYSGDANNNGATSACEPLTVTKITPTIATTVSATTINVGTTASDSATLSNFFSAGGTVTYSVFANSVCTAPGTVASVVTVTNGVIPNSRAVTFNATGGYAFQAVYSGDANNNGATSPCEPLTVQKVSPTISTTLSATTINVGTTATDSATLTGGFSAGGTVTYSVFTNSLCTAPGTSVSTVTVTGGVVPNSRAVTFNSTGSFSFQAIYSGDANNNGATSACEPLTVQKASPTIATTLSATTIIVGNTVTDSSALTSSFQASGTVTYSLFTNGLCTAPGTVVSTVTVAGGVVPNSRAVTFNSTGAFSFQAVYSGDANNNGATSPCEPLTVNKASPTIATVLSATTITVGGSVSDSSTLTGSFRASGTVTYEFFTGSTCAGTATTVGTAVTVTNGVVPNSASQAFNSAGAFSWNAVYSGDANNNGATSPCEPLTVSKASPTIATTLSSTSITVGTSVTDSSTLTGSFQAAGTVTYSFFANGVCTAPGTAVSTVTVTGGVVPNSRAVTFNSTGSFSFQAVYSGDANNNGATSPCEPLTVNKASPTIATTLSSTSIQVGQSVTDSATLSSFFQAGGTATYSVFANGACTAPGTAVSTVTVTNGVVPNSRSVLFNATGSYSFRAVYSGDANNNGATSGCEPLTVSPVGVTITTTLSATTITVGGSVSDSSTLHGQTATASGTVTYSDFANGNCAAPGTVVSVVTVTNGVVPNSRAVTFNSTGSFSFQAVYSGDANNNGAPSPCEPLTVNKASPTIATTLSATTITVGGSVSDSSVLTGSFSASGTVTYEFFTGSTCAGAATTVGTPVTVTGGVVPNSASQAFNSAGAFSWNAVYSGDANNNGATSPCEPLTVSKTNPTIATALSTTTPVVGTSVTDSSTLTGSFQASGTVTYTVFANGTCAAPGTVASIVTVTSGSVPNSRAVLFNSTGSFGFQAVYSGDANNNGATSPCEPLTVQKASPTIATTLSSTSIVVGNTVTDSSTLTGGFSAGGTVTYSFFTNGLCTAPGTAVSTVTVTAGVVPNSRAVRFNATGSFSFQAVYSGDTNNNGATSPCEPFTVTKASPTIATTLSATTITVGQTVTDSSTLTGSFSAGGTVQYNLFTNGACTAPSTAVSTVTVTGGVVPNSRAVMFNATGPYSFQAVYSGDANNNGATSPCEPLQVNQVGGVTIATTLSATSITVGGSVSDSATLTGTTATAGGTVTYSLFTNGLCTAPGTVVSVVTVTNHIVPNSRSVTFNSTGTFSFIAVYSGDANNGGATSPCEPLTVNKASPTIATTLSATTITVGSSVSDSSTLTSGFNAGGTVTYEFFTGSTCAGTATIVGSTVTVANGVVPNSASRAFNSAGAFSWNAVYSGDANNNGATSPCEPLTVSKASPTIATTLSATTVRIGGSVSDSASLTGSFQAGGTVQYDVFANGICTAPFSVASTVTVTGGVVPNSRAVTFNATGSYAFQAVYSGDANNNGATSPCEPLTVNNALTITTTLSATTVTVGGSVTDSAALSGQTANAGGTVTYSLFTNGLCTVPGTVVSVVTVANGVVPNSRAVTFNSTGSFSFNAAYSGDINNPAATSACEPLTVQKASPTIATTLAATTITVGGSVSDSSVLTGSYKASGTVTYEFFTGSTCAGTATTVGTAVTVTNGVVPNSASQAFNSAGAFSWNAVYSGDANNNGATSPCEPLTVNKASPTIATTLSATTVTVGSSVTDSSALTGAFQAGGTVTYQFFTGSTCAGTATTVGSPVTVANGVVPNSASQAFNSAGAFSWNAVYSGDANNNGATSPCEPLTVNKTNPTIATTLSATSIVVGNTVTDSSTLTGSFQAGGTVTYSVFTNGACTAPGTAVSTVTVTGGVVPNSRAVKFNSTGSFSFNAVYSGDANNNGATSACEPLTVNKASPTITTTLSATTIAVGGSVTDSSTLANFFQAGGTVTYTVFANGACTAPGTVASVVTVTNGVVPNSRAVTFNATGPYAFQAIYSGDANNNAATSPCEPLSVGTVQVTITTTLSSTSIIVGSSVTDSATLAGATASAGGTVTYNLFTNGVCTAPGTAASIVTVMNGVVPNSRAVTFNSTGSFSFNAVYSGDANNNGATSPCEPLTVNKASPTINTTVSATSVTIGDSVSDSSTLTNFFQAGGSVTYTLFSNNACTGTGTVVSTVQVTNGVVPNSSPTTPATAGFYAFQASFSGDANNNPATSACEPFSVNDFTLTAATTTITVSVGSSSAPDTLTMTSLGGFTGSITLSTNTLPTGVFAMFVPNPVSINAAGGSNTSNLTISVGTSVAPQTFSLIVTGTNMTLTHTVTISVTITAPAVPSFTDGKLHWTHHLSLSKSSTQSWTAVVSNPLATSANLVVRIIGSAANNPTETFDITCGVTCVNTASGGVNATPGLTPVSVASGAKTSFSFSQMSLGSFVNLKVTFTAQLWWTTGSTYQMSPTVKSGAFAVVP